MKDKHYATFDEIEGRYHVIYADPPWQYNFAPSKPASIKYDTMSIDDIKALPVQRICEPNCVLYIWATAPKLIQCVETIDAWGFEYKSNMVWVKNIDGGMGYWSRVRHEHLLIATKGKFSPPKQGDRPTSVIDIKKSLHSVKPHYVIKMLTERYRLKRKIELFGRQPTHGWDIFGNDISKQQGVF